MSWGYSQLGSNLFFIRSQTLKNHSLKLHPTIILKVAIHDTVFRFVGL